jgi:hypothetical protein
MYAEIHAKSALNENSAGKTMWIDAQEISVECSTSTSTHPDSLPWHLKIHANSYDESVGPRNDEMKAFSRKLVIHLTPEDLSKILSVALERRLISISVAKDAPLQA